MALKVGTLYQEITLEDAKFRAGLERAHGQVQGFGGTLTGLAGRIAAGLGIYTLLSGAIGGIGGAIHSTIAVGVAYQDTMNTLRAVSGATAAQMTDLGKRAMDLGNDLSLPATSAADAATAMTELVKSGLSVQDSMDAAKGVLQLAAAATVDEGTAALFTADALNAFHLKGKDAIMVADLLAGAANASSGEITDMAASLQQAGAVFAAAHVPIQTTVALIAELGNAGIRGSDAGTSLKSMMLALQTPIGQQVTLMKQLNLSLYDAHGNMRDFRDIIKDAQGPLSKLTQQERDHALGVIFGSDAVRAANIIFGQGADALDKMTEAVSKQGSAANVAAAKSQGLGGAWKGLESQIETFQLSLDQKAFPALETFIRALSENFPKAADAALSKFDDLMRVVDELSDRTGDAFQEAAPSIREDQRIIGVWKDEFVKNIGEAVKSSGPQFDALKADFSDLGVEMGNFGKSEAFASIVATFTVLIPAAFRPTVAGLQVMIDQFRITATGLFGLVQVTWDVMHGDWKKAWEDSSATVKTQTENWDRLTKDEGALVVATQKATSDDVIAEYNRMKDQTFIAMNGVKQNELQVANEARIAMGVAAVETGGAYTAGLDDGMRAGGHRVADAASVVVGDAIVRAHDAAEDSAEVGAFLAQGIAIGVANNSGFISAAAVAATRNAVNEARSAAMAQAQATSSGGGGNLGSGRAMGGIIGRASGGIIPGFPMGGILPGYSPGRDSVLAMLSPGEAVLRPEATRMLGASLIDRLNGIRSGASAAGQAAPGGRPVNVTQNFYGPTADHRQMLADAAWEARRLR